MLFKNKKYNPMKYIIYFLLATSILNSITSVEAHDTQEKYWNLNVETKIKLENTLNSFFQKTDAYEENIKKSLYKNIKERVLFYKTKYNKNTESYSVLQILDTLAHHKLDKESILTNAQILKHILYWIQIQHYSKSEVITPVEENNGQAWEDDTQENTDNSNSNNLIYKADLNTDALNELDKNILAGTAKWVIQLEIKANLENIKTETVQFNFNQNIEWIGISGNLYKNWVLVWTASQWNVRWNTLRFNNIADLIIDTKTTYVQLEIVTEAIGQDQVWKAQNNLKVTSTIFQDNTGVITGDTIWDITNTQISKNFNIVPVDLEGSLDSNFNVDSAISSINITPKVLQNNKDWDIFQAQLNKITVQVSWFFSSGTISVFNGNGDEIWNTNITWNGNFTIPLSPDFISLEWENYRIVTSARWSFILSQDAFTYSAGGDIYTSRWDKQIILGQR